MHPGLIQLAAATVLGLLAHWGCFVHGEHDLAAANVAHFHALVPVLICFLKYGFEELLWHESIQQTGILFAVYIIALFSSIVAYRIFLSPLKHIQGPLLWRVTKLTHLWERARRRNCDILNDLHKRYGDIVRTGPNEVTVFGTEAFYKVNGKGSACARAGYYEIAHPLVSLTTYRDLTEHAKRRSVWNQAFTTKALERIEPLIYEKASLLVKQLSSRTGLPLDISAWMEYYTFDVMGETGLTIKFKNLERGTPDPIVSLYRIANQRLEPLAAAPWIKHLIMGLPFAEKSGHYRQFLSWATAELQRNVQEVDEKRTDIMSYLINDARKNGGIEANWRFLLGDFGLVIGAASEPVYHALSTLLYYLLCQPSHTDKIRAELNTIDIRDYRALQQLPHLNACIYETMRLHPGIPSAGLRQAPAEGIEIHGTFIPGGTTIAAPQYCLFRDARNFRRPLDWIPERFTTQPDLVLDKHAFKPWSVGRFACAGKHLSLMEIRIAAALLLTQLDFQLAPGEDGKRMFSEALDNFTCTPGPLKVVVIQGGGEK
ncbi:cytochrome P450 [Aspergillus recurvatus]